MSTIKEAELTNGLKLIGEINPRAASSAIGFFVRTGSRDESKKEAGVSHFLEHMMFKGTARRKALDITFEMGSIGAQANAFTSEEQTVYYAGILPEYFTQMQDLLSDMLRPSLDIEEFTTEKKVILEEIALYQDRPVFYLFEHAMADYFGSHTAGNSVLGSIQSITDLSRDEMRTYFERRYAPNNMILAACGNYDWDKFAKDAERHCGKWSRMNVSRETKPYARSSGSQKEYRRPNTTQAHVVLLTEGASGQDPFRFELSTLACILGDGNGSKLYWALVDKGLAESAGADNDEKDGTGVFMAFASSEPSNIDNIAKIVKDIMAKPLDFSIEDLERAKTKIISRMVLQGELPMGRLMSIGPEWHYNQSIPTLHQEIECYKKVSKSGIEKALQRYGLKTWSEFRLLPE